MKVRRRTSLVEVLKRPSKRRNRASVAGITSGTVPDATTSTKGKIKLAGDLEGTADSPQIKAGVIVDSDVNAGAAIAQSKISGLVSDLAGKQPLDSDLTAIAALTTTSFGRAFLEIANAGAGRTALGLVIGTDVQAYDSDLAAIAALSTTSFGRSLLTQANAGAALTTIGAAAASHTHSQSDITGLTAALALLAPLASPALTGNPTAPTQSAGNNSTRLATTAYADGAVSTASTNDRARANHTGTQTASTISDFNTAVRTNRLDQMANPTGPVVGYDATGSTHFVTKSQMEQGDLESQAGYERLSDVDFWPINQNLANSWQHSTRTGNVLTATGNRTLEIWEIGMTVGGAGTGRIMELGETIVLTLGGSPFLTGADNGIWELTQKGSGSLPWKLTRRADADTTGDLVQFNVVRAKSTGHQFYLETADPIVINTTAQVWQPFKFYPSEHAASHLPGGSDALTTAAAGTIQPDDTAATGTATSFARSDHKHSIVTDTPVSVGTANSEGSATSFARSDHVHKLDAPGCRVYRSTDQGINSGSWTAVSYDAERHDPDNMWTSGANITIPKTGVYSLWANVKWDTNTTGNRYIYIGASTAGVIALKHWVRAISESQDISTISKLAAGETVAVYVLQDSGTSPIKLKAGAPYQEFAVQYIGTGL